MADTYVHNDGSECLWSVTDQAWLKMHPLYPTRECHESHEPQCEGLAPFRCGNPSCPAHGTPASVASMIEDLETHAEDPDAVLAIASDLRNLLGVRDRRDVVTPPEGGAPR